MTDLITLLLLIFTTFLISFILFYWWASSKSYSQAKYAEILTSDLPLQRKPKETYTVITYNIGYLSGLTNNQAVKREKVLFDENLELAIAALKPFNADFIALQEVDFASQRSYDVNQVQELATALKFPVQATAINWDNNYVPFPTFPIYAHFGKMLSGQAILSRYPIELNERIVLEQVTNKPFYENAFYLDRLAQVSRIKIANHILILINVHLEAFDQPTRLKQSQFVLELFLSFSQKYPVLLIGDFNSEPPSEINLEPTINLFLNTPGIQSAFPPKTLNHPENGTYPSDQPHRTIDYIFYNQNKIEAIEWQVVTDILASDHLPVVMKFRFR
ncbi:endonuclease/exonuclease/phosphatase family protein [Lyngbya sp. PCC 8106]|uniref:endonuclease/exonuclease/phosphatase family protein n=1 Tax=Lyngbya sp. (strain PCC 8106) TaxID=313612 RepID=UPI0000EA9E54|nr:endonuclease/exonuclease/phosphatase family protein [Lyngbya sp. PCC 8106]EAW38975.1 Endonuclease/exonuclease/phosphatase [Lyngbya sp. PCC 8106]